MKIYQLYARNVEQTILKILNSQEECLVYGIPDKKYVFIGFQNNEINLENLKKYNIEILKFPNEGGVIVVDIGDLDFGYFSKDLNNKFNENLALKICEYLKNNNINVEIVKNDLIIDKKYKCGSFSSRIFNNVKYSAFHISINVNLDIIKAICVKPMIKIPKGLSEYGITGLELKDYLMEYLKND